MKTIQAQAIGWSGKLPWLGDFVGRGMPQPWLRTWDDWIQRSLVEAERVLGVKDLRERLHGMATWQCVVLPAGAGQPTWCGVVAASADRVGRVYPLLLAEAYDEASLNRATLTQLQSRGLALSDWLYETAALPSLDAFEQAALQLAATPWVGEAAPAVRLEDTVGGLRRTWPAASSFWWCTEPVGDMRNPLAEAWPPREALMLALLGMPH